MYSTAVAEIFVNRASMVEDFPFTVMLVSHCAMEVPVLQAAEMYKYEHTA